MIRPPEGIAEILPFPDTDVPVIRYIQGRLPTIVDSAEEALMDGCVPVYSRGSVLVTPVMASIPASDGRVFLSPRLRIVSDTWLIERLTAAARFERYDARMQGWRWVNCPRDVAQTLLARSAWQLAPLSGMLAAPSLRGDGTPIEMEGYDPYSHLIVDFQGSTFPPIPDAPSRDEAGRSLELMVEAFSTFPTVGDIDRSVIVSSLLTSLVRRSLPTAPLHAIAAHSAGSGKSLLVDTVAMIATGRPCPVMTLARTAEEQEKRLGAMLIEGDAMISLDNVNQPLNGDLLCQTLSQEVVKVRLLGQSKTIEAPTGATFFATGNNLRIVGDLTRRCVLARLDPGCENPETREFARDAIAYALANRSRLVIAALTIMRAHAVAGRPTSLPPLGGFVAWSSMVRDAIVWSGGADPVASLDQARASDPEREGLRAVMWAWNERFGQDATTVAEIMHAVTSIAPALKLALANVAGERGEVDARRLGKWLAKHAERRLDGARFVRAGERQGVAVWQLVGFVGVVG